MVIKVYPTVAGKLSKWLVLFIMHCALPGLIAKVRATNL